MSLRLTVKERNSLSALLLDAFSQEEDLETVVRQAWNRSLDQVRKSDGGALQNRIDDIIEYAQNRDGGVDELLGAARAVRERHSGLRDFVWQGEPVLVAVTPVGVAAPASCAAREEALGQARSGLAAAAEHLDRMREYKEIHDSLQELQLSYRLLQPKVYQEFDETRLRERLDWDEGVREKTQLMRSIQRLCDAVADSSLGDADGDWTGELDKAAPIIENAWSHHSIDELDQGMYAVSEIVAQQGSPADERLMVEIDALRLDQLVTALRRVATIDAAAGNPGQDAIQIADVDRLAELNERLKRLQKQHHDWQVLDDTLRNERLQLTRARTAAYLARMWQHDLHQKLLTRCADDPTERSGNMAQAIGELDAALAAALSSTSQVLEQLREVHNKLENCWSCMNLRFNAVDVDLKRLCKDLVGEDRFWRLKLGSPS